MLRGSVLGHRGSAKALRQACAGHAERRRPVRLERSRGNRGRAKQHGRGKREHAATALALAQPEVGSLRKAGPEEGCLGLAVPLPAGRLTG